MFFFHTMYPKHSFFSLHWSYSLPHLFSPSSLPEPWGFIGLQCSPTRSPHPACLCQLCAPQVEAANTWSCLLLSTVLITPCEMLGDSLESRYPGWGQMAQVLLHPMSQVEVSHQQQPDARQLPAGLVNAE